MNFSLNLADQTSDSMEITVTIPFLISNTHRVNIFKFIQFTHETFVTPFPYTNIKPCLGTTLTQMSINKVTKKKVICHFYKIWHRIFHMSMSIFFCFNRIFCQYFLSFKLKWRFFTIFAVSLRQTTHSIRFLEEIDWFMNENQNQEKIISIVCLFPTFQSRQSTPPQRNIFFQSFLYSFFINIPDALLHFVSVLTKACFFFRCKC